MNSRASPSRFVYPPAEWPDAPIEGLSDSEAEEFNRRKDAILGLAAGKTYANLLYMAIISDDANVGSEVSQESGRRGLRMLTSRVAAQLCKRRSQMLASTTCMLARSVN
jgi:hypothetical protein